MKKSILEENMFTDKFFAWFRLVLNHSNLKRQFELQNFWSRFKMASAHRVLIVWSHCPRNVADLVQTDLFSKMALLFSCVLTLTIKAWDDSSMTGHSKMYTSGYRRVNRRRLRTQIEDCCDENSEYILLGTPPPVGECLRLVNR